MLMRFPFSHCQIHQALFIVDEGDIVPVAVVRQRHITSTASGAVYSYSMECQEHLYSESEERTKLVERYCAQQARDGGAIYYEPNCRNC